MSAARRPSTRTPPTKRKKEEGEAYCVRESWPGFELCYLGLRYLGERNGRPPNFTKAAAYFSAAAEIGDARGIFNLGRMHHAGQGFPKDAAKAHALFLQAAAQDPMKEFVEGSGDILRNFGVAEACNNVGAAFRFGGVEGVEVDLKKALEWFGKALEFGHSDSAFSIVSIFMDDEAPGLSSSFAIGMDYLKLGAHLKVVLALKCFAMAYLGMEMFRDAQEWFHFAVHNGVVDLEERRAEFVRDERLERNFDAKKFGAALEEEVRRSEVVGPVLQKIEDFQKKVKQPGCSVKCYCGRKKKREESR